MIWFIAPFFAIASYFAIDPFFTIDPFFAIAPFFCYYTNLYQLTSYQIKYKKSHKNKH